MNVIFAVKVLSSTVAKVLQKYYGREAHGTAEFCEYMKFFFDCLKVRNQIEGVKQWKSFLQPCTDLKNEHLKWLKMTFHSTY